jgi:pimeloyl-ACP methyl ester carboxylesterase
MLPPLQSAANIAYRESGRRDAPALVLLHGIGSTSAGWRLQYAPLGERFRVVAWDAPGYGESRPLPGETPSVDAYVEALVRLLDALGIERAILGSNSWGTITAVGLARRHPERVRGLVLGGPAAGMAMLSAEERAKAVAARVERIARLGPAKMRDEDATRLVAPGASAEVLAWIRNPAGVTVEGYSQAARMMGAADVVGEIAAVRCPVTVVSGERDIVTPPEAHAKRIAAAAPQARFESLPDCGHLPHLERAERFNAAVLELARAAER